jgi:death-on-curing protein
MTEYLNLHDVISMQKILIKKYGGGEGIRDLGALESALYRPQTGYYKDIIAEAAALFESIAINHPFVDGNKRIAFAATDVFLRINGFKICDTSENIYKKMIELFESGNFKFDKLDEFLRIITREIKTK